MISSAVNITHDLTPNKEKPLWPLSSYGPSKHEPLLLAGLDESPEELRVKAFTALKAGNINEYVSWAAISLYDPVLTFIFLKLQYESNKISDAELTFSVSTFNPNYIPIAKSHLILLRMPETTQIGPTNKLSKIANCQLLSQMPPNRPLHSVPTQVPHFPQHHLRSVTIPPPQCHLPLEIPQQQHQHSEPPPHPHPRSGNHRPLANRRSVKLLPLPQQQVHSVNHSTITTPGLYPPFLHNRNRNHNLLSDSLHKEHRRRRLVSLRRLARHRPLHQLLNLRLREHLVRLLGHLVRLEPRITLRRHLLPQEAAAAAAAVGFRRSLGSLLLLDSAQARRIIRVRCSVKRRLDSRRRRMRLLQWVRRVCLGHQHRERDRDLCLVRLQRLAR